MSKSSEELQPSTLSKNNEVRDINLEYYSDPSTNDTYAIDEQILMTPQEFLPVPEDEVIRIISLKRVHTTNLNINFRYGIDNALGKLLFRQPTLFP